MVKKYKCDNCTDGRKHPCLLKFKVDKGKMVSEPAVCPFYPYQVPVWVKQ